jgi:hypothetical protein
VLSQTICAEARVGASRAIRDSDNRARREVMESLARKEALCRQWEGGERPEP